MTHWMCTKCGYHIRSSAPPHQCPACGLACAFNNVTCYRPECGGEENVDPLLVGATLAGITGPPAKSVHRVKPPQCEAVALGDLFRGLSEGQIEYIRSLGKVLLYPADGVICREGSEADRLFLVEEGQVTVQASANGFSIPVTTVSPGQAFAWSALVPPYRLTATVKASQPTRVLAIGRDALLEVMKDDASLAVPLMQNLAGITASRLRNLQQELWGALRYSY